MKSNWFQRYLLPGFVFQSVIIAGGYGTGRELVEFFMAYGSLGGLLSMVFVVTTIWSLVNVASFEFARVFRVFDYRSFFQKLLGPGWIIFEISYILLMLIVLGSDRRNGGDDVTGRDGSSVRRGYGGYDGVGWPPGLSRKRVDREIPRRMVAVSVRGLHRDVRVGIREVRRGHPGCFGGGGDQTGLVAGWRPVCRLQSGGHRVGPVHSPPRDVTAGRRDRRRSCRTDRDHPSHSVLPSRCSGNILRCSIRSYR